MLLVIIFTRTNSNHFKLLKSQNNRLDFKNYNQIKLNAIA